MALADYVVRRIMTAVGSASEGRLIADALNAANAHAAQSPICLAGIIVATATSQTTDFASLAVGDKVFMIPATAGNADFITITVAGDLGQAAVVGNAYLVTRPLVLDAASTVKF